MSLYLSYLLIPIIILIVIANLYFRLKIIKIYKRLANEQIYLPPKYIFKPKMTEQLAQKHYPKQAEDIIAFATQMRRLLSFTFTGFLIIIAIFLMIKLSA